MAVLAVVGGQWGDEGKGKIVDFLANDADIVVRCQGGSNAGHTVVNSLGTFRMHLIPSGIFSPATTCVIGNGVVIDPAGVLEELEVLRRGRIDASRLRISERAHVIMPYHVLLDRLEEEAKGKDSIGTTGRGIGPAYVDKVARLGIRMGDLLSEKSLHQKLNLVLPIKNRILTQLYDAEALTFDEVFSAYLEYGRRLAPHITDTQALLDSAVEEGQTIILEGAQGAMLDVDFGTYPFVTSSSASVGGTCLGSGIPPTKLDYVLGVFKVYSTRVGKGPIPTELTDATGEYIREQGGEGHQEYGTTTGRPRRCGWFDAVAARFVARLNGLSGAAITRLDVFDGLPTIKVCAAYRLRGDLIRDFPSDLSALAEVEPVYEEYPGWLSPTAGVRSYEDLPANARAYLSRLEELIGVNLDLISVAPSREATIALRAIVPSGRRGTLDLSR
ncbi:MAG: adenylosuccinate synthase [Chloroflexi bacterium]|nr:adenylosuccinate synthase [Chloroflexota bacterium]